MTIFEASSPTIPSSFAVASGIVELSLKINSSPFSVPIRSSFFC